MSNRRWWSFLALIVVLTLARVATTHRVFSQTLDESAHLIAGYDALTKHVFTTDPMHPALARMLFAIPFVHEPNPEVEPRGTKLLLRNDRYTQNLARMRMGNLVFLAMGIVAVALWARRLLSPLAGLLAAVLYASLPPVLAHAGLATTDMAASATLVLALYALDLLLEEDTWWRMAGLGVAIGIGLLSKYSFVVYFPLCAAVLLAMRRRLPALKLAVAMAIAALLVAAVMPPHDYFAGLIEVKLKNSDRPTAFLFGEARAGGWWYYFPVAIFFKTPIPFLVLAIAGCWRRREAAAIAAVILALAMMSSINIGVRHVLPLYGFLAIAAAAVRIRWLTITCTAWLVIGSALAHPDYLAWFNVFAGPEPHRVLNDSNLDWGQDVLRLVRLARAEKMPSITTSLAGDTPLDQIGLPPRKDLKVFEPVHGWVAISELHIALGRELSPEIRKWVDDLLRGRPYRRVGKSIRLYRFE